MKTSFNASVFLMMLSFHEFLGHDVCPEVAWWLVS